MLIECSMHLSEAKKRLKQLMKISIGSAHIIRIVKENERNTKQRTIS